MEMEKAKKIVGEVMEKLATELQFINQKKSLNSSDVDCLKKMLEAMKDAACIMDMAEQAEKVIVVTESSKFSRSSTVPLALPGGVYGVITDNLIKPETEQMLDRANIKVFKAE